MFSGLTRTVEPAAVAVELADVKAYLRISDTDSDAMLTVRIAQVTDIVEEFTGRALISQTWRATFDTIGKRREFVLPRPPLQSVTSVEYFGTGATWATLSSGLYDVDADRTPGIIRIRSGQVPSTHSTILPRYRITYVAGYGAASTDIPEGLHLVLKMKLAMIHDECNDETSMRGLDVILNRYRIPRFTQNRLVA